MLKMLSFSIVVVAEHHNPSILNPDFLARNDIVPDAWGWKTTPDCFSTPPMSQVRYDRGVAITCEPGKLQVIETGDQVDVPASRIDAMILKYLDALPHTPCTGLGVNFRAAIPTDDPDRLLGSIFLADGPLSRPAVRPLGLGLRLRYAHEDARLELSLEAGSLRSGSGAGEGRKAVIAGANFHHDLSPGFPSAAISRIMERKQGYADRFRELVTEILRPALETNS